MVHPFAKYFFKTFVFLNFLTSWPDWWTSCQKLHEKPIYGRKSIDRIATQSMSKICNVWRLIAVERDYAESYGRFLSGGNADASHAVYITIVPVSVNNPLT